MLRRAIAGAADLDWLPLLRQHDRPLIIDRCITPLARYAQLLPQADLVKTDLREHLVIADNRARCVMTDCLLNQSASVLEASLMLHALAALAGPGGAVAMTVRFGKRGEHEPTGPITPEEFFDLADLPGKWNREVSSVCMGGEYR
jgi:hypothetical protein